VCIFQQVARQHARSVFHESLAGTKPYPSRGTQFEVVDVQVLMYAETKEKRSMHTQLEATFQQCRHKLQDERGRTGAQLEQQYAFVGCRSVNC
jgi:hypothetical protein